MATMMEQAAEQLKKNRVVNPEDYAIFSTFEKGPTIEGVRKSLELTGKPEKKGPN